MPGPGPSQAEHLSKADLLQLVHACSTKLDENAVGRSILLGLKNFRKGGGIFF